jgi:nucleoside-diphosphate-sugar epimerase
MLLQDGWQVFAFTRSEITGTKVGDKKNVTWNVLDDSLLDKSLGKNFIPYWICLAPVLHLPEQIPLMEACGARRVVALSSTSIITKEGSSSADEKNIAASLQQGESRFIEWSQSRHIEWILLRCTMIYGRGKDKNITELAKLIARFGVFPLFGEANGMRQPVHMSDVALACRAALTAPSEANHTYTLSGGECISYREMIHRIFNALNKRPRFVTVPLWLFRLGLKILRIIPRYRQWNPAMAVRMNQDLVFEHTDAMRDLDFQPRPFSLTRQDVSF